MRLLPVLALLLACAVAEARPPTVDILTLNLRTSLDDAPRRERVIAAFLKRTRPDVLLFQEVAPPAAAQVERILPPGYQVVFRQNPSTHRGLAIAARHPIASSRHLHLPGSGRPALGAIITVGRRSFSVVDLHLTPELDASRTRTKELTRAVAFLTELGAENGVLGGDFNFGDGAPEHSVVQGLVDTFRNKRRRGTGPGFTWDIRKNPLAAKNGYPGEPSRRLDRLLLRGCLTPVRSRLVLDKKVRVPDGKAVMASDHFGYLATVRLPAGVKCPPRWGRHK